MEGQSLFLRRLAVLVDSVDLSSANQILENIPDHTADRIRQHVSVLGKVSRHEREEVLRQFLFAVKGVRENLFSVPESIADNADSKTQSLHASSTLVE